MDTGNPWDSAAPVAPVPETSFAAFDQSSEASAAAGSSDWAAFNESEMKPVEAAEPAVEAAPAEEAAPAVEAAPAEIAASEPEPEAGASSEAAAADDVAA